MNTSTCAVQSLDCEDAELFNRIRLGGCVLISIINHSFDAIFIHGADGRILWINHTMLTMYGFDSKNEAMQVDVAALSDASVNDERMVEQCFAGARADQAIFFPWRARRPQTGETFDVEVFLRRLHAENGELLFFAQVRDVTERRQTERRLAQERQRTEEALTRLVAAQHELQRQAVTDPMTDLPNRRYLDNIAEQVLARVQRENLPVSLLMIDADHFKSINDRYGHAAGDEVLRLLAQQINLTIRTADTVARIGGEEFCVLLPATTRAVAQEVAQRIRTRVADASFHFASQPIPLTVSIGIATAEPGSQSTLEAMLHEGDIALYRAKRAGRNRVAGCDAVHEY